MDQRGHQAHFSMLPSMTPVVKTLIIANVGIWLVLQLIVGRVILGQADFLMRIFGLVPHNVLSNFFLWELVTYMFLHALSPFHLIFNMLSLWWIGAELEQRWGSRFFTLYYFFTGVGAGLLYLIALSIFGLFGANVPLLSPVVGASGAIFGLILAYGIIFGERILYFAFLFPMRAKWFVLILGAAELLMLLNNGLGNGVANLAHLGGIVSGFAFLMTYTRLQQSRWRKQTGRRGRGLRLVVDNDRKEKKKDTKTDNDGPRYWN